MTEEIYQQCRKLMQRINYLRGMITTAKGEVKKWQHIYEENSTDKTKCMLYKAMTKLNDRYKDFAEIKFPDSNIPNQEPERCPDCKAKIKDCACNS